MYEVRLERVFPERVSTVRAYLECPADGCDAFIRNPILNPSGPQSLYCPDHREEPSPGKR